MRHKPFPEFPQKRQHTWNEKVVLWQGRAFGTLRAIYIQRDSRTLNLQSGNYINKRNMAKKQIIWSSDYYMNDEAREEYENSQRELLDDDGYSVSDRIWTEVVDGYLSDERMNLDQKVDGVIIAFADLGLWRGRRQGYRILGSTINDIFRVSEDDNEWYGDGFNIRGRLTHHDGTHHVLYRVAKDHDDAERIADKIYNLEIDEAGFRKRTRSLYPYVAAIYGWKNRRFNKTPKAAV